MSTPAWSQGAERELTERESLEVIGRALRYVRPLWGRFTVKLLYACASLLPLLLLPLPARILIDHVINGVPISPVPERYPVYLHPFLELLADASRAEIAITVGVFSMLLLLLVGGISGSLNDTEPELAQGLDGPSTADNQANDSRSRAGGLLGLFEVRWHLRLTQRLNHLYRAKAFERIQTLPLTRFDDQSIGDALYRVLYDTPAITELAYRFTVTPIVATLHIVLTSYLLSEVYPEAPSLGWLALGVIPVATGIGLPYTRWIRRATERNRVAGASAARSIDEIMSNILAVQSQGGQVRETRRFAEDSWSSFSAWRRLILLFALAYGSAALAGVVVITYVYYQVTDMLFAGVFTAGDIAVLIVYLRQITTSAAGLASLWLRNQNEIATLRRVFWIMDQPGELEPPGLPELPTIRDGVEIEDVDYSFPDGTRALRGISLSARVGQMIGLVGPAGAGKTTLSYLIPRFVDPERGSVRIDGVDLQTVSRASLRSQVAFVFQETVLLDATVEENIRLGKPGASDLEVRRAAETAGAHEFIERLPQGYQTRLGRDGGQLSIGQRQRLSIARALVRQAPILILDEPTSALDPSTERDLVRALLDARRHSLVVVIAHRLSTVRAADQILFVEEGQIRERGTHEELMQRADGGYRHFVELQTRGAA